MNRSNSVPAITFGSPGLLIAQTGVRHSPRPARTPPAARPFTKVRLEVLECMPFFPSVNLVKPSGPS
ncbi:hypothetical protein D3C85_1896460 [compost metagenome]